MNRLSFRKDPKPTGLYAVGNPYPETHVKLDGLSVGSIRPPIWSDKDAKWRLLLRVEREPTPEDPAPFKNMILKTRWDNESDARAFVQKNWQTILTNFKLHKMEV